MGGPVPAGLQLRVDSFQAEEVVGIGEPQRLKHDRIDDVEHRGVEPDAQRERNQRDDSETGGLGELPEGKAEVVHGKRGEERVVSGEQGKADGAEAGRRAERG